VSEPRQVPAPDWGNVPPCGSTAVPVPALTGTAACSVTTGAPACAVSIPPASVCPVGALRVVFRRTRTLSTTSTGTAYTRQP